MGLQEVGWEGIDLAHDRDKLRASLMRYEPSVMRGIS
jgi:hypothetical protein